MKLTYLYILKQTKEKFENTHTYYVIHSLIREAITLTVMLLQKNIKATFGFIWVLGIVHIFHSSRNRRTHVTNYLNYELCASKNSFDMYSLLNSLNSI